MNNLPNKAGNIFVSSVITTIKHVGKITLISIAWGLKFSGMFILKFGEVVERIIVKSNR